MRRRVVGLAVAFLVVAACGQRAATTSEKSPGTEPPGKLRVTQHQTECCYTEGQISFLIVRDSSGKEVAAREFQAINPIFPALQVDLPAGRYQVESYQRPCEGNCGSLDPPADRCEAEVNLRAGQSVFLTAEFAPGRGCALEQTTAALDSPVPDDFALRPAYKDCGIDISQESADEESLGVDERNCFLEANAAGRTAELWAYEMGSDPETPDFLVYRTNADRTVDVYLPNMGRPSDGPWRRYSCGDLEADKERVFVLVDCTEPGQL
jgi:hypothetical protein